MELVELTAILNTNNALILIEPTNSSKPSLRNAESACVIFRLVEPFVGLTHFLLLCDQLIALMGRILYHAVIHWHIILCCLLLVSPVALAELFECDAKLLRHEVVNDGVDGTVGVDAHTAEEQEPGVVVRRVDKGVDHHQCSVRHPKQGEEDDHHSQHLCYLLMQRDRQMCKETRNKSNVIMWQ